MDVNIGNPHDPGFGLYIMSFECQSTKEKCCGLYIKMSILKNLIQKIKIQATNWEKILAKFIFDTAFGHKIDKDLLNNPINNK